MHIKLPRIVIVQAFNISRVESVYSNMSSNIHFVSLLKYISTHHILHVLNITTALFLKVSWTVMSILRQLGQAV